MNQPIHTRSHPASLIRVGGVNPSSDGQAGFADPYVIIRAVIPENKDQDLSCLAISETDEPGRDLEIPITANKKDHSGRDGGVGSYVGPYDALGNLAEDPIRFTVPATYGRYRHVGWLVDGKKDPESANSIRVSKSCYITALCQE
jgi:hypothetical protein